MERALDGAWLRHEILAENVANSETPGYKRQDIHFIDALKRASKPGLTLLTTDKGHLGARPGIKASTAEQGTQDVDMDLEMAEVSANAMYYAAVSRHLSGFLALIRKAATEGRR